MSTYRRAACLSISVLVLPNIENASWANIDSGVLHGHFYRVLKQITRTLVGESRKTSLTRHGDEDSEWGPISGGDGAT